PSDVLGLLLQDRVWRRLVYQWIGVAMEELPNTVFLPKDVRDPQRGRSRFVLTHDKHLASLDRHGVRQIAADPGGKELDRHLGSAFTEPSRGPIVPRAYVLPALFIGAPPTHDRDIVAMRGILLPKAGITVDEAAGALFEPGQERSQACIAGSCGS